MPTENRSSNTEMVSVPRELVARIARAGCWPNDAEELRALLDQPAEQHQAEPACWVNDQQLLLCSKSPRHVEPNNPMLHNQPRNVAGSTVQGDYCNTPLFRHADAGEVERWKNLHAAIQLQRDYHRDRGDALRAQLVERDALLRDFAQFEVVENDQDAWQDLLSQASLLLSASAEPSAPAIFICRVDEACGDTTDRPVPAGWAEHCAGVMQVERDERADLEEYFAKVGLPMDVLPTGEYLIPATRFVSQGWYARAALERNPAALVAQLQADLTARDQQIDELISGLTRITKEFPLGHPAFAIACEVLGELDAEALPPEEAP